MLRRRSKTPKLERHATPGPAAPSRRRARRDTPVRPDLKIPPPLGGGRGRVNDIVLVTGFEPLGGETVNPSWEICGALPPFIAGLRVVTCRVPCEFRRAIEVVTDAIDRHQPALVVCLGQAGGRSRLGVERIAINVDDARAPDNAGRQPIDEPIEAGGPPAYFATLPVKAMVAAMRKAGVPAELSNTAGTYVCNHLMYGVLHFLAQRRRPREGGDPITRAGFIHVPYSEAQVLDKAGIAAMSVASMTRGIEAGIAAAAATTTDLRTVEGTLD